MRKLSWIIAGILCTTPVTLMAAELGAAKLESHLTERLKVIIPISGLNGTPLDEVKVSLAPEHFYDQAGLSMDSLAGNIMFQIKPGAKGPYVLVSSKRSISDPILSMLLEIKTTNGHFVKEYDLLLNPPVRGNSFRTATQKPSITQHSAQLAATNNPVATNSTASTPTWATVKDVPDVKMDEQYKVKRGDTLYDIAKQSAAKSKVAVRPMMQAIINANPKAFVDGNGNSLMAGAVLKVPGGAANAASAPTQTAKTTQDETVTPPAVETGTETQPKLQLLSPDSEPATRANTASQNTTNATTSSDTTTANGQPKLSAIDTPSEDQSATTAQQNNEAIASIDAKSEAMSQQINLLNTQLKQVQDQIQVRNQNIDLLQKKIHNSESQTKTLQLQLEEQKNSFWIQWSPYLAGGVGLLIIVLLLLLMARGRRDRDTYEARSAELKTPMPPLANIENDAEKTLNSPTTEAHKFSAAAPTLIAAAGMAAIPAFNAQTLIEESRLLVSYNLHPQAIEMLQDALNDHPDELPLYQELARIHAEAKNETSLPDILGEIDHRFGPDQRPDMSDIQQHISLQSAPIPIFEQKVSSANSQVPPPQLKTSTTDPVETFEILDINTQKDETNDIEFSLEDLNPAHDSAAPRSLNLDLPPSTIDDENLDTLDLPKHKYEGIQTDGGDDAHSQGEKNNDTRLGLVEAFLGVGDMESYRMIAEEIEGEGDPELISSLRNIEKAHGV